MLPPDAFLGPVLSFAGATLTAVDYGVRLAATDDDLRVSRIVLGTIDSTISHVLSERTRLSSALPSDTQQRIDKTLFDATEVVEIVRKMVNPEGKDEDVGAARRLKWVFKQRGTVLSYQSGLLILQSTLLGISAELSQVNAHPPPGYSETFPHADAPGLHASYIIEDLKRWNLLEKPKPAVQGEIQSKVLLSHRQSLPSLPRISTDFPPPSDAYQIAEEGSSKVLEPEVDTRITWLRAQHRGYQRSVSANQPSHSIMNA